MKIAGEYRIAADREAVWRGINDAAILQQCIPGCEEIIQETPTDWTARVVAKVGPVKARFAGRIRLEDLMPPESCRLVGEGSGGAAGFAKGGATVTLAADGGYTVLRYDADAQVGGKLAQIGARLIDGFARKYADDFFSRFAEVVAHAPAEGGTRPAQAVPTEPTASLSAPSPTAMPAAPVPRHAPPPSAAPHRLFDAQGFTIVVLAALLVFMTIMYALKP